MGGCRCIYRECSVATSRHPRMHFFRFPLKDPARMLKWVKLAKVPQILQLPISMQRNKCVCARHFRDECFMNYMKDKLVPTALPTLERIKGGYALDYEDDVDKPKIVKLPDPVLTHMIPPPDFECPLHLEELEHTDYLDESFNRPYKSRNSPGAPKRKTVTSTSTRDKDASPSKKFKILNTQAPVKEIESSDGDSDSYIKKYVQYVDFVEEQEEVLHNCIVMEEDSQDQSTEGENIDTVTIEMETESEIQNVQLVPPTIIELPQKRQPTSSKSQRSLEITIREYELQLEKERAKYLGYEEESSRQQMQLVEALQTANNDLDIKTLQYDQETQELKTKIEDLTARNSELESQNENLVITNSLLKGRLTNLEEQHANLLEQYKQLEESNIAMQQLQQQQQQVSTVSTSNNNTTAVSLAAAAPQPTLSKAQLYNGIKKYLSTSMVALVRMEMFGSAERQWKEDEKQVSLDLLTLGEQVYRYFTDEWRFRLPSLRQVLSWKNENSLPQDEEDL